MLIIFLVLGLIVGSFLNVLVYRLHEAEDIFLDRSRCPHCKKVISWYDNIPVISFIILQAKCRKCKKGISWRYPLGETLTGILFAAVGFLYFDAGNMDSWAPTIYLLGVAGALVLIFMYDLIYMEIPDVILWPSVFWAVAFGLFFNWNIVGIREDLINMPFYSKMLAASVAFIFLFLLSYVSKERWMGMGDAYLAILLGLIVGWPAILLALFLSFLVGSVFGIILVMSKKKTMNSEVPFAPFLVIGTIISMFFSGPIIQWYMSLLN